MKEENIFLGFRKSKRIFLREVRNEDVNDAYYRWMNDGEITKYLESRYYPNSLESLKEYVNNNKNNDLNVFFAIVLKENKYHIGNIKLGPINWIHRFADVGIIIGEKNYWGKGYGTEAIKLVADYAFYTLNLNKLNSGCYAVNRASIKAFEKAGFAQEGVKKKQYFFEGKYIDDVQLGLLNNCSMEK
jgi:[ribosomal protein S5]-alanine N-acetyltransferase